MIASNNGWDDDLKMKNARLHLTGEASDWFEYAFIPAADYTLMAYQEDPLPTWPEFQDKFIQNYRPIGIEVLLEKQLQDLKKNSTETYMAFALRVIGLIRQIDPKMSDFRQQMHIRDGLSNDPIA